MGQIFQHQLPGYMVVLQGHSSSYGKKGKRKGKIINLASDVVKLPPSEVLLPYACSKAAVHQITQCLARALGPSGICVNSIAPGMTATETNLIQPDSEQIFEATIAMQCVKRREDLKIWPAWRYSWPLRIQT